VGQVIVTQRKKQVQKITNYNAVITTVRFSKTLIEH